jgi:transketolase
VICDKAAHDTVPRANTLIEGHPMANSADLKTATPGQYGELDQQAVNAIRIMAMDAVQAANSGHPGTAMALAPLTHVLFSRVMNFDPTDPNWHDRDRFVLSPGHASILLYSMLFLSGFGLELDDIKKFRQLGSKTPGHPERGHTAGVEVTTGPLGQGISNAVGMALAEANQRARFGEDLCSHYTYAIVSDGDLMEGISHEAASLAGHLGLGRLVVIYDDNHITIDGATELALNDDAGMRFKSYGWHVMEVGEIANDMPELEKAIREAMAVTDKPSFIRLRSHIGFPSPNKTDTSAAHGSPLGAEEIALTKAAMGVSPNAFELPDGVVEAYRANGQRSQATARSWKQRVAANGKGGAYQQLISGSLPAGWDSGLPTYETGKMSATREASGECFNALTSTVPSLVGGGADLTGNTGTMIKGVGTFSTTTPEGRLIHFGVREHAMAAIMNGMAAHGGAIPVGGTFFVFSDYMRGAVRVGAISQLKVIYSWTHDSLGVGEDGPTHQPIEQLASLRAMPGLRLIRPADGNEVAAAWRIAIEAPEGPTGLVLGRQKVPTLPGTSTLAAAGVARGAYVLVEANKDEPDVILVGTGSEVQHCVKAAEMLVTEGISAQVVSMPSWDLFDDQDDDYMDSVFPPGIPVVACEAGTSFGWERFADLAVTVDTWGASAPSELLMEEYGLSADSVFEAALLLLESE